MRKADTFLLFTLGNLILFGLMILHAGLSARADLPRLNQQAQIVQRLRLTDLCLSNEAWHTRHPSQSDWHSPFQSHPLALEHFPSGAVIIPPARMKTNHAPLD